MYLLYADESGNPDSTDDQYFVLGGIAMYETRVYWLNEAVDKLEAQFFPPTIHVEFHAQPILSHKEEPWHSMPSKIRAQIFDGLCSTIAGNDVVLFGVALERATTKEPVARAFEELCNRFDLFLKRLHARGNTQRGLVIFDESRYESRLQTLLGEFRSTGTRFGKKLANFADIPLFADSKSTRLLQLADVVAYSIFRRYERSDTRLMDRIISKFDSEDNIMHGLVHLTANRAVCTCPACLTRRLAARA